MCLASAPFQKDFPLHPALGNLMGSVADGERFSEALSGYAASFRADLLGGAFLASGLDQLAQWGAQFAAHPEVDYWLQSPSSDGAPALLAMGVTPEAAQRYATHYRLSDPLWDDAMARRARMGLSGVWVATDAPLEATRGFRRTEIYNDFLRQYGIGTRMFGGSQGASSPVGNLFMSMFRQGDDEGFSREEVARFEAEFATVQRAAYLHREMVALRARTRGMEALMEQMPMGILFFDTAGRLLHANARVRALWAGAGQGGLLQTLQRGPLLASTADPTLRALFVQSLQGHSGCVELDGGLLLVALSISDLASLGMLQQAPGVAWVVMQRSLGCEAAVALARQAYRLSPAEADLLQALMRGQTPQDFADARGVRITTVRTQLSALLFKTRTVRQQDLVALVARLMLLAPGGQPLA
ncbi:LuxR family transcriptional regulator [Acidovorax sp. Leaf78]|nr:LuxR family transcriptional regulator [Acidovorax sp. Leaf78]RZJ60388.1 MAG: helix-turn-helix transcriptional regulator [Acidovorax sp.]